MHFCRPALKLTLTFWMKEFSQERYSELVPWSKAHMVSTWMTFQLIIAKKLREWGLGRGRRKNQRLERP